MTYREEQPARRFEDLTDAEKREVMRRVNPVPLPFSHNPICVGYDQNGSEIWQDQPVIRDIL